MSALLKYAPLGTNDGRDLGAVSARLEAVYLDASPLQHTEGVEWYADKHAYLEFLAEVTGLAKERLAYVASALSPQTRWGNNQRALDAHVANWLKQGGPIRTETLYDTSDEKAYQLINGADYSVIGRGLKTNNFALNLLERSEGHGVTIDSITGQAAMGYTSAGIFTGRRYATISKAIRQLAAKYGLQPWEFQAIVWVVWRGTGA